MNSFIKKYIWFAGLIFTAGCASIPVYKCSVIKTTGTEFPESTSKYTDNDGQIEFGMVRDTQNVYISIVFLDKRAPAKLMRNGFNVYFNSHGKKEKEYTLMFPVKMEGDFMKNAEPRNDYERLAAQQHKGFKGMMEKFPDEAKWKDKSGTTVFRWRESSNPCKLEMITNEREQLVYHITLPLNQLFENNKKKTNLAIGFESKASGNNIGNRMGGPPGGGRPGGGEGGMGGPGGGNMPGGDGPGGPGNMGPRGGNPQGQPGQDQNANKSLKTWFLIPIND